MNKFYTALLALATIAMLVPASAQEACAMTTSNPELTISDGGASGEPIRYLDNDLCQPECIFSIWIYEESNTFEGLQRGDEVVNDFEGCGTLNEDGFWEPDGPNGGYMVDGAELFPDTIIF